ncbi:MAG: 2-phospho-L-lactate transferase [Anaerolineae bacterium]|nr:2-phospho-L-lactate transferase [Anaerolineae bacterium]
MTTLHAHVVLLVGGVGGAKLAVGLANVLPPGALSIIVNTGDDFEHLGLHISPDLDTVLYSLSDLANPQTGWGIANDTFHAMEMVGQYGGPTWFRLGDRDLATSLARTSMLREGKSLTEVTRHLATALGIEHAVLPMTDQSVQTRIETGDGCLAFQEYFVRERWQPIAQSIRFEDVENARPSQAVQQALGEATLIIFGPSNPFLSIDPILAIPGIRDTIAGSPVPCIAVSPIIGGQAVKGPAAKLMAELGHDVSSLGIATYYQDLLDGIILDTVDVEMCEEIEKLHIRAIARNILMTTLVEKTELAASLLQCIEEI